MISSFVGKSDNKWVNPCSGLFFDPLNAIQTPTLAASW